MTREKNRKSLYIASVYNYKRITLRGMEVGLLRRDLACGRGLHTKEHNKINFLFFSEKKNILEMISKYDAINYEFVHLVYESIFFIVCSPNFKIRTCCGPTLPRLRGKLELQTRGRFGGKRDKKAFTGLYCILASNILFRTLLGLLCCDLGGATP